MVMFFTDGLIGDDDFVLGTLQEHLREETRVFAVGVGNDVNRYLVAKMGEVGRGASTFVNLHRPEDGGGARVRDAHPRPGAHLACDVDTDGLPVADVYPRVVPRPVQRPAAVPGREVPRHGRGRSSGSPAGCAGRSVASRCRCASPRPRRSNSALQSLWARQRIEELTVEGYRGETPEVVQGITATALQYGLMSKYTSFVAVEEVARTEPGGESVKEMVPVQLPEGTSYAGVFGELSREEIPPGDPIITVMAPSAQRVTAYFPFGLVKPLLDPVSDCGAAASWCPK